MSKEQIFWVAVIIILNFAAYLIGKHEGKKDGYHNAVELIGAIAPEEMAIIKEKFDKIDPVKFAFDYVAKSYMEKNNGK